MKNLMISLLVMLTLSACTQLKETGRGIGHASKEATTEIGHATRDATRAIGHASRDAVKSVKEEVNGQ